MLRRLGIRLALFASIYLTIASTGCEQPQPVVTDTPAETRQSESTSSSPTIHQPPTEQPSALTADSPKFEQQLAAVLRGESVAIHVATEPVSSEQLKKLSQTGDPLRDLMLDAGTVRDEDIAFFHGLSKLEHLRLRQSPITDRGAENLSELNLPELRVLNLPQSKLTAVGMRALAKLPKLNQLRLGGNQIDDEAVDALKDMKQLQSVHLIGPSLSDRSLITIAELPKLGSFYLDDCPLSDAAWEQLFKSRPTLHVHIDQQHPDRS
ncbi:MAG: hypothetical protein U0892_04425 [Pirellulales bacterium]